MICRYGALLFSFRLALFSSFLVLGFWVGIPVLYPLGERIRLLVAPDLDFFCKN